MLFRLLSCWLLVIFTGTVFASPPLAHAEDERQVWEYTNGFFKEQGRGGWVETDRDGKLLFKFVEIKRNDDFVEIYDSSRSYTVHLCKTAMYIKGGNIRKFNVLTKILDGKWIAVAHSAMRSFPHDNLPPPFVTVMPVFFVPKGEEAPSKDQVSRFMRHILIAQEWYKKALGNRDTFTIVKDGPKIIHGKNSIAYYKLTKNHEIPLVEELLDHFNLNRYNCPYDFVTVIMNPKEDWPGAGGHPLNRGFNRGGGIVGLSSFILDNLKFFQGVVMHELGHSFGLVHPSAYGYSMTTSRTIMAANVAFKGWSGFTPPEKPNILLPEDIRALASNHRVFPRLFFDPSQDISSGYKIAPRVILAFAEEGAPPHDSSINKRK